MFLSSDDAERNMLVSLDASDRADSSFTISSSFCASFGTAAADLFCAKLPAFLPKDAFAFVAFTSSDLWPGEGWNFVFGQASMEGRIGVWCKNQKALDACVAAGWKIEGPYPAWLADNVWLVNGPLANGTK